MCGWTGGSAGWSGGCPAGGSAGGSACVDDWWKAGPAGTGRLAPRAAIRVLFGRAALAGCGALSVCAEVGCGSREGPRGLAVALSVLPAARTTTRTATCTISGQVSVRQRSIQCWSRWRLVSPAGGLSSGGRTRGALGSRGASAFLRTRQETASADPDKRECDGCQDLAWPTRARQVASARSSAFQAFARPLPIRRAHTYGNERQTPVGPPPDRSRPSRAGWLGTTTHARHGATGHAHTRSSTTRVRPWTHAQSPEHQTRGRL